MLKILYICTHNRCRSILSEALTNHYGEQWLMARSAGSQPSGEVHPLSLRYLEQEGITIQGLESQSWDEFESFAPDIVVTVCDSAANEVCPVWFGNSVKVHWGLSDPSKMQGTDQEIEDSFLACIEQIKQRIAPLIAIAKQGINGNQQALQDAMEQLVKMEA